MITRFRAALAYALAAALLATPANAVERKLTCTGVLEVRNDELRLKPDPGSALWCDASFDGWNKQCHLREQRKLVHLQ
jgi:hypothetical protein